MLRIRQKRVKKNDHINESYFRNDLLLLNKLLVPRGAYQADTLATVHLCQYSSLQRTLLLLSIIVCEGVYTLHVFIDISELE